FLWEDHAFWVLTGPWARLAERLARDPVFELVVDSCDLATGTVHQVIARGRGRVVDFDTDRGRRKLTRYLGEREELWDARFSLRGDPSARGTRWALLVPDTLWIADLSFRPPGEARTDRP
ncbi:pyridoxamine 5'-phosphate oxidase family protein, partial [Streptomyces sp. NPDC020125]|uniref:pyridoxamine 5'-phosphate oxidase family protein n=1 Tax=Streptomyces sp. NPDC020125 TaxID=3154593 RepID=UPI0033F3B08F